MFSVATAKGIDWVWDCKSVSIRALKRISRAVRFDFRRDRDYKRALLARIQHQMGAISDSEDFLMLKPSKKRKTCSVLEVRKLTDSTAVVRFERDGLDFEPGQYIRVGIEGDPEIRDYSVYSGTNADYLEVLVRRVEDGLVSKELCDVEVGEQLSVGGPYGHFKLIEELRDQSLLFIATGSGLSPYHSFVESYPELNYRLIHGTSKLDEAYDAEAYGSNYFHCVSREEGGDFKGRVTDYLQTLDADRDSHAFLCGNCDMIYEAFDLLQEKGLPTANIHTEVYF